MAFLCKEVIIRLLLPPLLHHVLGQHPSERTRSMPPALSPSDGPRSPSRPDSTSFAGTI